MGVRKVTISLDPELYAAVKADTERKGMTVSSWLSDAAAEKLRQQAWDEYMATYQAEHGEFTDEELGRPLPVDVRERKEAKGC